jgi:hypothetical protein
MFVRIFVNFEVLSKHFKQVLYFDGPHKHIFIVPFRLSVLNFHPLFLNLNLASPQMLSIF